LKKTVLALLVIMILPGTAGAETPSDGWIVFASDRQGGRHEIFLMRADGTNVSQLTTTGAKFPIWSPNGAWIAYRTEPTLRTRVMRWDKSQDKEIFAGEPLFFMHDGSGLVCADGDDLYRVDPDNGSSQYMFRKDDFSHLVGKSWGPGGISANGRWLVAWSDRYRNGYTGTNGTFDSYHCAVILDIQNKGDIFFLPRVRQLRHLPGRVPHGGGRPDDPLLLRGGDGPRRRRLGPRVLPAHLHRRGLADLRGHHRLPRPRHLPVRDLRPPPGRR